MTRPRFAWKALLVVLTLLLILVSPASAIAAGSPGKTQVVNYAYDSSAGTFTLSTETSFGSYEYPSFTGATFEVDRVGIGAIGHLVCWDDLYLDAGWGKSTCVWSNFGSPSRAIEATATFGNAPIGATYTSVGEFNVRCMNVTRRGCAGTKTVTMTVSP